MKLLRILSIIFLILTITFNQVPSYADQVWGDAVDVIGSNHDQSIELTITQGESWTTPLNVYIIDSGQAVEFPVSGLIDFDSGLELSKSDWQVNSYDSPDQVQIGKIEDTVGTFSYSVTFRATTDLDELSKTFDRVNIRVNVLEPVINVEDITAPIITAPDDITVEATAILTPIEIGTATVDDETATISNDSPGEFPIGSTTVTWTATDPSGNIGTDQQIITVVDTTPPVFTTLPQDLTITYSGNQTPVDLGTVEATDIFPVTITNNAPTGGFPLGLTSVQWVATDENGNTTTVTQNVRIQYNFFGFLQPINNDNSSVFKLNSTIPVKFQLFDSNSNPVSTAIANINVSKITDNVTGTEIEDVSTSSSTSGNLFRYDYTNQQYIFNLNTKPLSKGTFLLIVRLDDGTEHSVQISLK